MVGTSASLVFWGFRRPSVGSFEVVTLGWPGVGQTEADAHFRVPFETNPPSFNTPSPAQRPFFVQAIAHVCRRLFLFGGGVSLNPISSSKIARATGLCWISFILVNLVSKHPTTYPILSI